jgi:hypothetical protein
MTVIAHIGHHPALAWRIVEGGNIDRALERSPGLEERLINEMGVDEEGRPYIQPDQERINAVLRKLAAGLFYLKYDEAPGLEAFHPIAWRLCRCLDQISDQLPMLREISVSASSIPASRFPISSSAYAWRNAA